MSVNLEMADKVAVISFDDGKANAVSNELIANLHQALNDAEPKAKAILLVGRPGRFSAGFDLRVMQGATPQEVTELVNGGGKLALRLFSMRMPVVAACTGHAIAMGALLLLACDTRIGAGGEFKIGLNETAIGMPLPVFGLELPRARLASAYVTRSIIQGELFDPETATSAGFLDATAAAEDLGKTALAAASALSELPTEAYAANKLAFRKEAIERIEAGF